MRDKVLVIGSLNYDIILKIGHVHKTGETLTADSANFCGGGKGANQAVQCAKLGLKTYMAGSIGSDAAGNFLLDNLKQYNVETDYVKIVNGASGMAAVNAVEDGSVYATIVKGANYEMTKESIDELVSIMQECAVVILQLEIPISVVSYAIKVAKENGCIIILNAAPAVDIMEECIRQTDVFVVNEVEAGFYTNKDIDSVDIAKMEAMKMAQKYENKCIFTLGKDGLVVSDGENVKFVPSLLVESIETTGAGDSFVGGLAYSIIHRKSIFEAAEFATYCSAITVCGIGAQPSMPYLSQVMEKITYDSR